MTTANQLRDALLAIARPQPKKLPPALAGVFPAGTFIRAHTAAEDVSTHVTIAKHKGPDDEHVYEKNLRSILIGLSYSLCDENGDLIAPGEWQQFGNLPYWTVDEINRELSTLAKAEQAEQGKD